MERRQVCNETNNTSEQDLQKIKTAVMEVMKDLSKAGVLPDQESRIEESKIGSITAIKDSGLTDKKDQETEREEKTTVEEGEGGRKTKREVRTKTKS